MDFWPQGPFSPSTDRLRDQQAEDGREQFHLSPSAQIEAA